MLMLLHGAILLVSCIDIEGDEGLQLWRFAAEYTEEIMSS